MVEKNDFWTAFTYINEQLYIPCQLTPHGIREEGQNAAYGAGSFFSRKRPFVFWLLK